MKKKKKKWTKKKLKLMGEGNLIVWEEFYKDFGRCIFRWCLFLTGNENDAWDLYQDALIEIISSVSRCIKINSLVPYLYGIVNNVWRNQLRAKAREKRNWQEVWPILLANLKDGKNISKEDAEELIKKIWLLLDRLTVRQREAFLLYYDKLLPIKEIANEMNISLTAVRVHLHSAIKKLRELLNRYGDD